MPIATGSKVPRSTIQIHRAPAIHREGLRRVWGQSPGIGYGMGPFWFLSGYRIDEIQRAPLLTRYFLPHRPCDRFCAREGPWRADRI